MSEVTSEDGEQRGRLRKSGFSPFEPSSHGGQPLPTTPCHPGRRRRSCNTCGGSLWGLPARSCLRWLPLWHRGGMEQGRTLTAQRLQTSPTCLHLASTNLTHRNPMSSASGYSHTTAFPASTPPRGSPVLLQVLEPYSPRKSHPPSNPRWSLCLLPCCHKHPLPTPPPEARGSQPSLYKRGFTGDCLLTRQAPGHKPQKS